MSVGLQNFKVVLYGLILYLEKFGWILYFDFFAKHIYLVKNTSSKIINSELISSQSYFFVYFSENAAMYRNSSV